MDTADTYVWKNIKINKILYKNNEYDVIRLEFNLYTYTKVPTTCHRAEFLRKQIQLGRGCFNATLNCKNVLQACVVLCCVHETLGKINEATPHGVLACPKLERCPAGPGCNGGGGGVVMATPPLAAPMTPETRIYVCAGPVFRRFHVRSPPDMKYYWQMEYNESH